jgi:hypothetical protein
VRAIVSRDEALASAIRVRELVRHR